MYWTSRDVPVPRGFLPQLDEWAPIDSRERALGFEPGTPILIDPVGRIDPRLAYFLRRSRFAFLAEETRHAYAKDYRLFFSFVHQREKYWDQADHEDIDDYESWRRRSADNPRRIGGSKWARELAAFKLLYGWAAAVGHIGRSPVLTLTVRRRDGTVMEVANNRPKDVRASNVKWLTPRTYRLWRDIGLRGYDAAGLPQQGWRGRNDGRNAAFHFPHLSRGWVFRSGGTCPACGLLAPPGGGRVRASLPRLLIMARRRARILGPATTIRRRPNHAIHGVGSVMSADDHDHHALFMSSSGSPGSWPSWATDVRYLTSTYAGTRKLARIFRNLITYQRGELDLPDRPCAGSAAGRP